MTYALIAIIGVAEVLLLVFLGHHWSHLNKLSRVTMAGLVFLFLPVSLGAAVITKGVHEMTEVTFCKSCHVMEGYVASLHSEDSDSIPAIHFQNNWVPQKTACYECHTSYTMFGGVKAKMNGLKHVWVNYFSTIPETLKTYEPYANRDCLRCHGPAKKFRENEEHADELEGLESGETSCLECHDVMHLLPKGGT